MRLALFYVLLPGLTCWLIAKALTLTNLNYLRGLLIEVNPSVLFVTLVIGFVAVWMACSGGRWR